MKSYVIAASLMSLLPTSAYATSLDDQAEVTTADNCRPQPRCRADYDNMETVTIDKSLIINGKVFHRLVRVRRPIHPKADPTPADPE